jgi:hypothetical protein
MDIHIIKGDRRPYEVVHTDTNGKKSALFSHENPVFVVAFAQGYLAGRLPDNLFSIEVYINYTKGIHASEMTVVQTGHNVFSIIEERFYGADAALDQCVDRCKTIGLRVTFILDRHRRAYDTNDRLLTEAYIRGRKTPDPER